MIIRISFPQIGSHRNSLHAQPFHIDGTPQTVRELICACVRSCVSAHNEKLTATPKPKNEQALLDLAAAGKIAFGIIGSSTPADPEGACETAISAFRDGLFRLFLDNRELSDPDALVSLTEESVVTFIRLTMLAGSVFPGG